MFEIFIEENAFGAMRAVMVDEEKRVEKLIPELVEMLHLPPTDLFGRALIYTLHNASNAGIIPCYVTLHEAGIRPGTRLLLASTDDEETVATISMHAPPMTYVQQPQSSVDTRFHSDMTMADSAFFTGGLRENTSELHIPVARSSRSRRGFLLGLGSLVCGVAGVGVAYAGYEAYQKYSATGIQHGTMSTSKPVSVAKQPVPAAPFKATLISTFKRHQMTVRSLSWSPMGDMLASGADDKHVFIWRTDGALLLDLEHPASVSALSWSPDGQRLVTAANTQVTFFNTQQGTIVAQGVKHTQAVTSLAWSGAQNAQVISGANDHRVLVWNTTNYQVVKDYMKHGSAVQSLAWSPDGQTVISGGANGYLHVWNPMSLQDLHSPYVAKQAIRALAFAPGGTQIVAGGNDGSLNIWNGLLCQKTQAQICQDMPLVVLPASNIPVRSLAWSPDANYLAVGLNDGHVFIYQPAKSTQMLTSLLLAQGQPVHGLSWSPDSTKFAAAANTMVMLWSIR